LPDKEWMINIIATLSKGADEILQKNYMPPVAQRNGGQLHGSRMVDNQDGFFSGVPDGLYSNQKGKGITLSAMTKEEKLKARIAKADAKIAKEHERQQKLAKEIEMEKFKANLKRQDRFNLTDVTK